MHTLMLRNRRLLEVMLIAVSLGMTALFYRMGEQGSVALNLFFLPVILAGYYLGRTTSGILALLCALSVSIVAALSSPYLAAFDTPIMVGLALTIWAATLGLTAILMGTLCDERASAVNDLHRAYVGVVEVLSKYLQSANPHRKARSIRVAELSQTVAREMKLSRKQIDDIRVAALLHDLENVEITTQLISKAVTSLEREEETAQKYTFLGTDLVHSLGSVLEGALPLIVSQNDDLQACLELPEGIRNAEAGVGARIIAVVRNYDMLTSGNAIQTAVTPDDALRELRQALDRSKVCQGQESGPQDGEVLDALERVIRHAPEPAASRAGELEPVPI